MATKKECDRCLSQWSITSREETCAVAVTIPSRKWQRDRPSEQEVEVNKAYELCQDCARTVYKVLEKVNSVKSDGRNAS